MILERDRACADFDDKIFAACSRDEIARSYFKRVICIESDNGVVAVTFRVTNDIARRALIQDNTVIACAAVNRDEFAAVIDGIIATAAVDCDVRAVIFNRVVICAAVNRDEFAAVMDGIAASAAVDCIV